MPIKPNCELPLKFDLEFIVDLQHPVPVALSMELVEVAGRLTFVVDLRSANVESSERFRFVYRLRDYPQDAASFVLAGEFLQDPDLYAPLVDEKFSRNDLSRTYAYTTEFCEILLRSARGIRKRLTEYDVSLCLRFPIPRQVSAKTTIASGPAWRVFECGGFAKEVDCKQLGVYFMAVHAKIWEDYVSDD